MGFVSEFYRTLEESIVAYTGLSPATFFTILAVVFAFYHIVSGLFSPVSQKRSVDADREEFEPLPPPVQLGEVTEDELRTYDGSDPKKPLLMAIKGQIYDVSQSRTFYGPGGPYALFAAKDASRALAKMSFEEQDLTGNLEGLGAFELDTLQDWEYKFMSKYVKVGTVNRKAEPSEVSTHSKSAESPLDDANPKGVPTDKEVHQE